MQDLVKMATYFLSSSFLVLVLLVATVTDVNQLRYHHMLSLNNVDKMKVMAVNRYPARTDSTTTEVTAEPPKEEDKDADEKASADSTTSEPATTGKDNSKEETDAEKLKKQMQALEEEKKSIAEKEKALKEKEDAIKEKEKKLAEEKEKLEKDQDKKVSDRTATMDQLYQNLVFQDSTIKLSPQQQMEFIQMYMQNMAFLMSMQRVMGQAPFTPFFGQGDMYSLPRQPQIRGLFGANGQLVGNGSFYYGQSSPRSFYTSQLGQVPGLDIENPLYVSNLDQSNRALAQRYMGNINPHMAPTSQFHGSGGFNFGSNGMRF